MHIQVGQLMGRMQMQVVVLKNVSMLNRKKIIMKEKLLLICFLFFVSLLHSQEIQDSAQIKKAEVQFEKGNFTKAFKIYEVEALKYNSISLLNQAALCNEKISGENHCKYLKRKREQGFDMKDEEIFFFQCDPKTFEKIPIPKPD